MLQVVYVLICNDSNFFYEQFLISVTSLKFQMKNVEIVVLTDEDTNEYLKNTHSEIEELVSCINVYSMPEQYAMKDRSRALKTQMRNLIKGDFLYIDCDTLICEPLDAISKISFSAAVLDNHNTVSNNIWEFRNLIKMADRYGFSVGYHNCHYNTGVLWCKDNAKTRFFFEEWHHLWEAMNQKGIVIDQPSFNEINNRMNGVFQEIDGKWNCQIRCGLPFLADAKIIHYFASNNEKNLERKFSYYFADTRIYKNIRDSKYISKDIQSFIAKPKNAFYKASLVEIDTPDYYIIYSNIGALFRKIYRKCPKIFWLMSNVLDVFKLSK